MRFPGARVLGTGLAAVLLLSCSESLTENGDPDPVPETACASTAVSSAAPPNLALEHFSEGVPRPTAVAWPPGESRLYVTQQFTGVRIIEEDGSVHALRFVDLMGEVANGIEQGVLGIAFDPDFQDSGFFYLTYTDTEGHLHLVRYEVGDDPYEAEEHSVLLTVTQPDARHQGGYIVFGPDGMLYIALGDGGVNFDLAGNAQDPGTLKGSILRIDVSGGGGYTIPSDNPFVGDPNGRDEVWHYGLRNPWSISFDEPGGCLYIADVGEVRREEVNAVRSDLSGLNFGWNLMEGFLCFDPDDPGTAGTPGEDCDPTGLVLPVLDYSIPDGCRAVIGGHVYRGSAIPGLEGAYLYADFCNEWIRAFRLQDNMPVQEAEWTFPQMEHPVQIARSPSEELLVLTWDGEIFKLVEAE